LLSGTHSQDWQRALPSDGLWVTASLSCGTGKAPDGWHYTQRQISFQIGKNGPKGVDKGFRAVKLHKNSVISFDFLDGVLLFRYDCFRFVNLLSQF
jgi:hypothetical protein